MTADSFIILDHRATERRLPDTCLLAFHHKHATNFFRAQIEKDPTSFDGHSLQQQYLVYGAQACEHLEST